MRLGFLLCLALATVAPVTFAAGEKPATSAATRPVNLGPYQFDNVIYTLPAADWIKGRTSPHHVVVFPRDGLGVFVYVLRGAPLGTTDLQHWLETRLDSFNADLNADAVDSDKKTIVKRDVKQAKANPATNVLMATETVESKGHGKWIRIAIGRQVKDRGECVVMESSRPAEAQKWVKPFVEFAATMRFVNAGASPVIGKPVPGDLEGLYSGTRIGYGVGGMDVRQAFYLFAKSGRFYEGVPRGQALRGFDLEKAVIDAPAEAGNYQVADGHIKLAFADGRIEESEFKPGKDAALSMMGVTFFPAPLLPDGTTLAGAYTNLHYAAFVTGSGVNGGISSSRTFTFTRDGRYLLGSFAGASGNFQNGAGDLTGGFATSHAPKDQRGRYAIAGGLLTLTADDGTVARHSIVAFGDAMLVIDGASYLDEAKEKKKR